MNLFFKVFGTNHDNEIHTSFYAGPFLKKGETKDELAGGIYVLREKASKVKTDSWISAPSKKPEPDNITAKVLLIKFK